MMLSLSPAREYTDAGASERLFPIAVPRATMGPSSPIQPPVEMSRQAYTTLSKTPPS
jgi:hypothetical protein